MASARDEFNEMMRDKERRTGHPEDNDDDSDGRSFLNISDEEEDNDTTPAASQVDPDEDIRRPSITLGRNTIPLTRYEANTGPKGVISDAQNFRDSRRIHRTSMRSSSTLPADAANILSAPPSSMVSEKIAESDEDENDLVDDADFMRKWRKSRLRELQTGPRDSKMHTRKRSTRLWGGLTTVDGNGYLDALERSPPDAVVVVYIYDDYSHVSAAIEDCIKVLAQKHLDVRFIKLNFQDAEMEPAGVPALIAYRGGDKFAGLVPIMEEIPDDADLSSLTLETVLKRHQILR